ncbi:MAG: hypothetical protein AAF787_20315, partial [Chloroflexota bacterium]
PDILEAWDFIYRAQHRGSDNIGYVKTEWHGPTTCRTTHLHMYPDDLAYGIGYGWARRFLPVGTRFVVEYENAATTLDRGGNETVIVISW